MVNVIIEQELSFNLAMGYNLGYFMATVWPLRMFHHILFDSEIWGQILYVERGIYGKGYMLKGVYVAKFRYILMNQQTIKCVA